MSKHVTYDKETEFEEWYQHVIQEADMIRYHDVSGCYVMLPNSYFVWENIKGFLDMNFRHRNIQNCYFPMLISHSALKKEKEHLKDFAPEVAWVTGYGDIDHKNKKTKKTKEGKFHELDVPLAIRPTSETVMYQHYKSLIKSPMDLPLKLNQWNNVVRWEFKEPTPFIRSREFLWQEGHSCFSNKKDAILEVYDIIDLYQETYEKVLSVPTIKGMKTESEKFAGAEFTLTLEGFVPFNGKGVQACTAHHLGQQFSKMFDISYQNEKKKKSFVWQNSWGFTTRSIGLMLMLHGDDKGLVLPPQVATTRVVIVPIYTKKNEKKVMEYVSEVANGLDSQFVIIDKRDKKPGWKFNYWEMRGVPLRVEIGEKDIEENKVVLYRRDKDEKSIVPAPALNTTINFFLAVDIPENLYNRARDRLFDSIKYVVSLDEAKIAINNNMMFVCNFNEDVKLEEKIKNETGAKPLCIPMEKEFDTFKGNDCFISGEKNCGLVLFGKSY